MLSVWSPVKYGAPGVLEADMKTVFCTAKMLLSCIASWSRVILYGHPVIRCLIFCPHKGLLVI